MIAIGTSLIGVKQKKQFSNRIDLLFAFFGAKIHKCGNISKIV